MKDIQLEARVKELREALECSLSVMDAYCPDVEREIIASVRATFNNSSTGKEQLGKDLAECERVLGVLRKAEYGHNSTCWPMCLVCKEKPHTDTCELAALKKEWEAKRDNLMKLIGEI